MNRSRLVSSVAVVAVVALFGACKKDHATSDHAEAPPPAAHAAEPAAPVEAKKVVPTAASFGKAPAMPFGQVAKLKLGMSEADAKAAAPQFWDAKGELTAVTSKDDGLTYKPVVGAGRLTVIEITDPTFSDIGALLATAWGAGAEGKNLLGGKQWSWFDPASSTRAVVESDKLKLAEYQPLETFLGADKIAIAALPKPILGATLDDLKRDYAARFLKPDAKQLSFPPTEWERDNVVIWPTINSKGKVTDYHFTISDAAYPAAKDTTLAAFEKKWGKPKLKKPYGSTEDKMIFHAGNPLIEVQRAAAGAGGADSWQVEVRKIDDGCGGPCYQ